METLRFSRLIQLVTPESQYKAIATLPLHL
jgi:hypothetical protein